MTPLLLLLLSPASAITNQWQHTDGFFVHTDELIGEVIEDLKKEVDLKVEGTVTAFLGMEVYTNKKGAYALS